MVNLEEKHSNNPVQGYNNSKDNSNKILSIQTTQDVIFAYYVLITAL